MTGRYEFKDAFGSTQQPEPLGTHGFMNENNRFEMNGLLLPTRRDQINKLHSVYEQVTEDFWGAESKKSYGEFKDSLLKPLTLLTETLEKKHFEHVLGLNRNVQKGMDAVSVFDVLDALKRQVQYGFSILWVQNELIDDQNIVLVAYCLPSFSRNYLRYANTESFSFSPLKEEHVFAFDARLLNDQENYLKEVAQLVEQDKTLRSLKAKHANFRRESLERASKKREKQELAKAKELKASEQALTAVQRYMRVLGGSYDLIRFSETGTPFDVEGFRASANAMVSEKNKEGNLPYEAARAFIKYAEAENQTVHVEDLNIFVEAIDSTLQYGEKFCRTYYKENSLSGWKQPISHYSPPLNKDEIIAGEYWKLATSDVSFDEQQFIQWKNSFTQFMNDFQGR